jgi:hypothetical protein
MDEMLKMIANLGFPIAISIFLLVRVESRLEKLTESINILSNTISALDGTNRS